jgi:hypothetical protein
LGLTPRGKAQPAFAGVPDGTAAVRDLPAPQEIANEERHEDQAAADKGSEGQPGKRDQKDAERHRDGERCEGGRPAHEVAENRNNRSDSGERREEDGEAKNVTPVPTARRIQVSIASDLRLPSIRSAADWLPTAASSTS